MFSKLHERLGTAGLIVAIVALVAALTGSAFAASKYVTEKQAIKIAKKYAGKPGKDGAVGPQGQKGDKGDPGQNGQNGQNGSTGGTGATGPKGATGATGTTGSAGATGATGATGSPWTAEGTLPKGKTFTGAFNGVGGTVGGVADYPTTKKEGEEFIPISFPLPLSANPTVVVVKGNNDDKSAQGCPLPANWAVAGVPEAAEGKLCIYLGPALGGSSFSELTVSPKNPATNMLFAAGEGSSKEGTLLLAKCGAGAPASGCIDFGLWAVTGN